MSAARISRHVNAPRDSNPAGSSMSFRICSEESARVRMSLRANSAESAAIAQAVPGLSRCDSFRTRADYIERHRDTFS